MFEDLYVLKDAIKLSDLINHPVIVVNVIFAADTQALYIDSYSMSHEKRKML